MKFDLAHLFTPKHTNNQRPRLIHPEGLFVLTTLVLVFHVLLKTTPFFTPLGNVLGYSSSITATEVLREINQEREQEHLSNLAINKELSSAALSKAQNMFEEQYWAHMSPEGKEPWAFIQNTGYTYSIAGENLAKDFGDTQSMVQAWMDSSTHKANILQSKYTETGIAVIDGKLGGVETTLVVQMFGAPSKSMAELPQSSAKTTHANTFAKTAYNKSNPEVLSETIAITPYVSPLQLSKSFFLVTLLLLVTVMSYDMVIAGKKNLVRLVGKNLAHISLLIVVTLLILIYKGGSLI